MKKFLLIFIISIFVLTGCGKGKDIVVIYSSMEDNRTQALKEQLKERFKDIDVKVQSIATGNCAAKIKNEKTNVEADIVIDLETGYVDSLKDYFADLSEFDSSIYLDGINKSDKYFTWVKNTMNLIIDKDYFEKNNLKIPKTYDDLLNDKFKGLIAMPDPKTSGTGYAFFLNAVNVMGEKSALKYFKELEGNLREFTTSGSGPTNLLKQGEIVIGLGMTSQGVAAINEGYNFEIVQLDTGSPYNTTSAAIIKGREDNKNVVEVFDWLINEFGRYDKENFMPDIILKDQDNKMKNYPENLKDADMTNIDDINTKEKLLKLWSEVDG